MRLSGIELLLQGRNFLRLLEGLWVSASIALIAMAFSIVLGIGLGIVMTSRNPVVKLFTRIYLEVVRIMPQIVLLFLVFFDLARYLGVSLDGQAAAVVVFTLWGTAEMGDLVRSAITSIPKHQYASAQALGLTPWQVQWYVVLPQAAPASDQHQPDQPHDHDHSPGGSHRCGRGVEGRSADHRCQPFHPS